MEEKSGIERRKHKRLPIELNLSINELYKQDNIVINNIDASISVINISKSGIGFITATNLPVGYYFNGRINLSGGDFFRVVIQIVRSMKLSDDQFLFGAQFVGLAPFLADKVDRYEERLNDAGE